MRELKDRFQSKQLLKGFSRKLYTYGAKPDISWVLLLRMVHVGS